MNKIAPYILAAAAYFSPLRAHAEIWEPPADSIEFRTQRVVRHISYRNPMVYNSQCPLKFVPALEYSLVSRPGDTLGTILREFRKAGVRDLSTVQEKWKEYAKKAVPENLVFKLGEAGPCSR